MSVTKDTLVEWLNKKVGKGGVCYPEVMKVYAPTCYDKCIEDVEKLTSKVNEIFGGSTVYDAEGSWVNPRGELEREPVKVIEVAHNCIAPDVGEKLVEALVEYTKNAKQEYLSIHKGRFYITASKDLYDMLEEIKKKLPTM